MYRLLVWSNWLSPVCAKVNTLYYWYFLVVSDLLKNDCCIRCLAWVNEHCLVAGDEAGVLHFIDIRNTDNVVKLAEFPAAVHKVAMHPE